MIPRDRPGTPPRPEREGGGAEAAAPAPPWSLGGSTLAPAGSEQAAGDTPERGPRPSGDSGLYSEVPGVGARIHETDFLARNFPPT